ncbi:MAG: hypothetical protein LBK95_16145 [Bifidobacteriaceae bacterium]|nr:hypothetical protein [Bifidobacteriaceae bacterium]
MMVYRGDVLPVGALLEHALAVAAVGRRSRPPDGRLVSGRARDLPGGGGTRQPASVPASRHLDHRPLTGAGMSAPGGRVLDGRAVLSLFAELADRLEAEGLRARLFVVGGAAMALARCSATHPIPGVRAILLGRQRELRRLARGTITQS